MARCQGNGSRTYPVPELVCIQPVLELRDTYNDKLFGFEKLSTALHLNSLPDDVLILIMTLFFCIDCLHIVGLVHINILLNVVKIFFPIYLTY